EIQQRCAPYLKNIQGRVDDAQMQQAVDFVYENLPFFLSDADYIRLENRLNRDSISEIIEANLRAMLSPSGIVTSDYIRRDPMGLTFGALQQLKPAGNSEFAIENGYLTRSNGR